MKIEFNLVKLSEAAKYHWFKTQEIHQILKNAEDSNLKLLFLERLPERPSIGSFFLIYVEKSNKKWKQDGYSYIKRNNGIGFREDVVYLKVAGTKEIMCSYSYLDHNLTDPSNLPTCRRIYKLINGTGSNILYLVHYLNEKSSNEASTDKTSDIYMGETQCSALSTSDEISKSEGKQFEEETISPFPNLTDYMDKGTDSEAQDPLENIEEKALNFVSYFEANNDTGFSTNFFSEVDKFIDIPSFSNSILPALPQKEDMLSLGPINYGSIQNKFSEIENRLVNLENEKPSPLLQPLTAFPTYNKDTLFNIVDYSPEWDYTKGGTKVIICVNPLCLVAEAVNDRLKVYFGDFGVPGYFIQPGVIKCYAPPHTEGFVKLSLYINDELVTSNQVHNLFEYRKERKPRNTRKVGVVENDLGMTNDFKIRVVQKLREYDNLFGPTTETGRDIENEKMFRKYLDTNVEDLTNLNVNLYEADLLKILQFMISNNPKGKEKDFQSFLDKTDRHGYALIHYLCYLQYNNCLEFILNCGASPNLASAGGVIPLEISLKHKNENMLDILLAKGALGPKKVEEVLKKAYNHMPQNNLDIASLYKDRNLLDMLLREVSLCDSINNSLSVAFAESEKNSDDSYLSIHDFLDDTENINSDDFNFRRRREIEHQGYRGQNNGSQVDFNSKDRNQRKRPRRYFRNYDKKSLPQKENVNENTKNANIDPVIANDHQNQIKIIQKNVRGWLLRRQYLDILHATRVLQNYMRGKTAKKKNNEDEEPWDQILEDKLKSKVKDWLNIKE